MDEFVELVRNMRAEQNRYFRTRSQEALLASKKYECLVDAFIADHSQQLKLF